MHLAIQCIIAEKIVETPKLFLSQVLFFLNILIHANFLFRLYFIRIIKMLTKNTYLKSLIPTCFFNAFTSIYNAYIHLYF